MLDLLINSEVSKKLKKFAAELAVPLTDVNVRIIAVDEKGKFELWLYKKDERVRQVKLSEII